MDSLVDFFSSSPHCQFYQQEPCLLTNGTTLNSITILKQEKPYCHTYYEIIIQNLSLVANSYFILICFSLDCDFVLDPLIQHVNSVVEVVRTGVLIGDFDSFTISDFYGFTFLIFTLFLFSFLLVKLPLEVH